MTRRFRWQFTSDLAGDDWTDWHTVELPCSACCCNGPENGEHLHGTMDYDEDSVLSATHRRLDPTDIEPWQVVEYQE